MATIADKRRLFRDLHGQGSFALPNPYDAGTTRYLQSLGFKALATTSAGASWGMGRPDDGVARDVMLDHIRMIVEATDLPVNADFTNGYADDPEDVAENVRLCMATGVAGLSIEDMSGAEATSLYDIDHAVERVAAARAAIDAAGADAILVARSEAVRVGHPDSLNEAIRRLERFAEAGADCLYAPYVQTREAVTALVKAVAPKAVNVLIGGPVGLSMADLAELGVRRVSVGGALARAAWGSVIRAARELAESGTFESLGDAISYPEINGFFIEDASGRRGS
jgi:2-methylisocitrate lyase-like PEP mutase family enzyme